MISSADVVFHRRTTKRPIHLLVDVVCTAILPLYRLFPQLDLNYSTNPDPNIIQTKLYQPDHISVLDSALAIAG
jgi:hypothetical protein